MGIKKYSNVLCHRLNGKDSDPFTKRMEFQRDRDRIIHSRAFRRLMHKTQIFNANKGDHYRNRLTHTLEVMQITRSIGWALDLDEDLIEAVALGHDLGHTPFGHIGERALNEILSKGIDGYIKFFIRLICDHIAGMTDQLAAREYMRLYQLEYY